MEFILHYRGPLKANGGIRDKQKLRRYFHRQLKVLWNQDPLKESHYVLEDNPGSPNLSVIRRIEGSSFRFAPLICEAPLHLIADLQITLLRPESLGSIVTQAGDIDNRLKTLLDSLAVPKRAGLPADETPQEDEDPFFCLLEDDNLVTKLSVETDRLLEQVGSSSEVILLIRVKTSPSKLLRVQTE